MNALYVIFIPRTHFRGNIHSLVPWMSRNAFLEKNAISEVLVNTVQINTHNASQSLWVWILLLSRIVLCLNAFAKLQNVRGAPHQPDLMGKYPTCLYVLALSVYWMVYYQSFHVVCRAWDSVTTREVPLEKKVDSKYMQVNVLRNIASTKKKGDDIPTH